MGGPGVGQRPGAGSALNQVMLEKRAGGNWTLYAQTLVPSLGSSTRSFSSQNDKTEQKLMCQRLQVTTLKCVEPSRQVGNRAQV